EDHLEVIKRSKPEYGDTLFANIGTIGSTAFVGTDSEFSIKNIALFKPNPEKVDPKYLYYLVTSPVFQNHFKLSRSGAAQPFISLGTLRSRTFRCESDLTQQVKIASTLSAFDDLIENNTRRIQILEEMAQRIYREWFVHFRYPGHENEKLVDSGTKLGMIPEGWNIGTFDDLISFSNGYAFKSKELLKEESDECYRIFKMGQIKKGGGFDASKTKSYIKKDRCVGLDRYVLKSGDILMSMTDMKASVALLGHTALLNVDDRYILNQRVGLIRPNNSVSVSYPYLYLLTNSKPFIDDIRSRANSGVQVNLSTSGIKKTNVAIPPQEVNERFDVLSHPKFELIVNLQHENDLLIQTRDLLLPKLISGQIDVSDLDIGIGVRS
ncbi:MAG: restriction endonuclease subunit S, partial [Candidatus Marinimicrobia bacterium]|nr:restriction endonuclease subunit S [Candidatus Neomarinimicrobiota bacterium]MBT4944715.1 restriction endonuclease subunit S [Candidatus Neomarinimicrobiota bacterium]